MVTKAEFKKGIYAYLSGLGQEYSATLTEAEDRRFWRAWGEVSNEIDRKAAGGGQEVMEALYMGRSNYGDSSTEPIATGIKRAEGYDSEELKKMGMKGVVDFGA